jgi:hypothetical protein
MKKAPARLLDSWRNPQERCVKRKLIIDLFVSKVKKEMR